VNHAGWTGPIVAAALSIAAPAGAQPNHAALEAEAWRRDIRDHQPGTFDDTARRIASAPWPELRPPLGSTLEHGDAVLLLRSASLLTDIAVHVPLAERPRTADDGKAVVARDGTGSAVDSLDPHLAWSRRLIDRVVRDRSDASEMRGHAVAWYRAISAWLAGQLNLADLGPHVRRSLQLFPDDPGVVFDAACYFETFASPLFQATLAQDPPAPRRRRPRPRASDGATSADNLLKLAERHFRLALQLDPSFTEARVRLGRVLTLRGQPEAARGELETTIVDPGDPSLAYLRHLFLGRALDAVGQPAAAASAYGSALDLYPSAQAALLASSHLAARRGRSDEAGAALERLLSASAPARHGDPWSAYHHGNGRNAETMLDAFAARVRGAADVAAGIPRNEP
jgi:thioredoxin-like negative regulator of GroEL